MVALSASFQDVIELTAMFTDIFNERYKSEEPNIEEFYKVDRSARPNIRFSTVSGMGQLLEFTGQVDYGSIAQGYDVTITPVQFARGFSAERTLLDDDQHSIFAQKPRSLATAAARTRNYHKFLTFDNAFSIPSLFSIHTEGVALCSNSHTTTTGASTATGFDNLDTAALSPTAVSANRVKMLNFRDEQGERIDNMEPTLILVPQQGTMEQTAWEIVNSMGKPGDVVNDANFNRDRYTVKAKIQLSDANNWFMIDPGMMKENGLIWHDRVSPEFAQTEDFDSLLAKWRVYGRWGNGWVSWPWVNGNLVS